MWRFSNLCAAEIQGRSCGVRSARMWSWAAVCVQSDIVAILVVILVVILIVL